MSKPKQYILIYARISTYEQKKYPSIKNQIKAIKKHFKCRNIEIFTDINSGSETNRPGYQEMIIRMSSLKLKNHFCNVTIAVYKINRLHRSVFNASQFINNLKKTKIKINLVSITEPDININTDIGQYHIIKKVNEAELEAKIIKKRMIESKMNKFKQTNNPITLVPYGYDYDKKTKQITINKHEALIIKEIYKLKKKDFSMYRINLILRKKYPNDNINPTRIRNILLNPIYFGTKKQTLLGYTKNIKFPVILRHYWKNVHKKFIQSILNKKKIILNSY